MLNYLETNCMRVISPILVAFLLLTAVARAADETSDPAVFIDPQRVIEEAFVLVGTRDNAEALVEGLRLGSEIVLLENDSNSKSVRFQPPGGPIGYGNVSIALALTRASLSLQGIAQPTMRELADVLAGVLSLRAAGLRWGAVADALGFSLGDAVIVAGEEDSERRIALAAQHSHRSVEIIERSLEAQPSFRDTGAQLEEHSSK
jgi:hypothetical protein